MVHKLKIWQAGGYWYMSGLVNGEHVQGMFTSKRLAEADRRRIENRSYESPSNLFEELA